PFLAAGCAGTDPDAFFRGQRLWIDEGTPRFWIEPIGSLGAVSPGHFAKRFAIDELAVFAVEAIEVAVAVRLHNGFDLLAVLVEIDQHGFIDAVVVPDIMGTGLEVPFVGAVVGVEGQDTHGVEVVPLADVAIEVGTRIAHAPVESVEGGIEGAGDPRRTTSG